MAWPVYSTRFVRATAAGWTDVQVPPGYRAVVTDISSGHPGTVACQLLVQIAGLVVVTHAFPASPASYNFSCRIVSYAGEWMGVYMDSPNAGTLVSGYLFREAALARRTELVQEYHPAEEEWPEHVPELV
jgi:hypothetical protein